MAKKTTQSIGIKLVAYPKVLSFYYNWLIEEKKSERTIKEYINIIIKFINHFFVFGAPDDFYTQITPEDISEYLDSLQAKSGGGPGTATNVTKATTWSALNSFFQYLTPDYIKENPLATVKRPQVDKKPKQSHIPKLAKQILLDTPVEKLNLSQRAYNGLIEGEIFTIGSLCKLSSAELINLGSTRRLIGKKTLDEIEKKLSEVGLSLRDSSPITNEKTIDTEMRSKLHWSAQNWLNAILRNLRNNKVYINDHLAFAVYFLELKSTGIFQNGINLKDDPLSDIFPDTPWWEDLKRFTEAINEIQDYKLIAHIILLAMRRSKSRIFHEKLRNFYIVAFERLIILTEASPENNMDVAYRKRSKEVP